MQNLIDNSKRSLRQKTDKILSGFNITVYLVSIGMATLLDVAFFTKGMIGTFIVFSILLLGCIYEFVIPEIVNFLKSITHTKNKTK